MSDSWQVFDLNEMMKERPSTQVGFNKFLDVESMQCGLYFLKAGSQDMQAPHDDDEVYFVVEGRAKMRIGDSEHEITPGKLLYVQATEEHSLFEIEEDMTLLVVFA